MRAFSNQRHVAIAIASWIVCNSLLVTIIASQHQSVSYFKFGPHNELRFLGLQINSLTAWAWLMGFTVLTQTLKIVADEVLNPWILHSVMNDVTRVQGYAESMVICELYYAFSCLVRFVQVSVSVSQIDFVLALLLTDVAVSAYTTDRYLRAGEQATEEPLCLRQSNPLGAPCNQCDGHFNEGAHSYIMGCLEPGSWNAVVLAWSGCVDDAATRWRRHSYIHSYIMERRQLTAWVKVTR